MRRRISVSVWSVSSKPGVSMSVTLRPASSNDGEDRTSAVAESKPSPTGRFEPLTRLMNWTRGESPRTVTVAMNTYCRLPRPCSPNHAMKRWNQLGSSL